MPAIGLAQTPTLSPVTVQGQRETGNGPVEGFVAGIARTGTKTDTPLAEVPQAVSVITRDQMDQQNVHSVGDSLRYTPGVYADSRIGGVLESVFMRGFGGFAAAAINPQFLDGLPLPKGAGWAASVVDPSTLERIDVLRGPASVLYGQASPGGIVNMVSKRPTAQPFHELSIESGNRDRAQASLDISGPLTDDSTWSYRLNGMARRVDEQVDHSKQQRFVIAPTLEWKPDADTRLILLASLQNDPSNNFAGWLPAKGTLQANLAGRIPTRFFAGQPDYDDYSRKQAMLGYAFEHRFNNTWTVRQNLRYTRLDVDFKGVAVDYFAPFASGPGLLDRSASWSRERVNSLALDNQAQANFETGALRHTVLAGLSYERSSADMHASGFGPVPPIDYRAPNYNQPFGVPPLAQHTRQTPDRIGFYAQDQIRWDRWAVTLGGRQDRARMNTDDRLRGTSTRTQDRAFTGRIGAVYLFDNGIAPYASYSTSFEPTLGTDHAGNAFQPTKARQAEVGVKYQPAGSNSSFAVSAFDIRQRNVLTTDPSHPFYSVQTGAVRSRGIELEGRASLTNHLDLVAAYTYLDTTIASDTDNTLVGKRLAAVPRQLASLWLNYAFSDGDLAGLSIGGGVRHIGRSAGDSANTFGVPAVTLVDLALGYDLGAYRPALKGWRVAAHIGNLFDKTYVSSCFSEGGCFYGNRRTVTASLGYRW